jgi:hypothetical protein
MSLGLIVPKMAMDRLGGRSTEAKSGGTKEYTDVHN